MKKINTLSLQLIILSFTFLVLGTSFYLQYVKGFTPCPLCLMQRLCVIFILALGAINMTRATVSSSVLILLQAVFAGLGLFFAARQMWLITLPSGDVPACMPGLAVLIHYFPWQDTARALLWGSGECTEIRWTWLGLSMPLWSALYFLSIVILSSFYIRHRDLSHSS